MSKTQFYPFSTASGCAVRVRFCPSPTGTPHVGLIRTALFNWAYARHTGGKFIFRIEDTDAARDNEASYEQIIEALTWLGLEWDEGITVGGPHGPYRQSQRHDIYTEVVTKLIDSGHVYESFSTPEEIDARNKAAGRPTQLGYDNYDRTLTRAQRDAFLAEGRKPALRLRVPDVDISFTDLVRGDITFPEGSFVDFVIVRPNGAPLYAFVNAVDDVRMGVTHVLRGEDLLSSTPRQIALYHALIDTGMATVIPRFGHLPYVMGEGNKKLSKRDPQSNFFHYRDRGFLPEGILNYLALLGWSLTHDRDVFTIDEMIAAFDIADVNPNPARFDAKKAESLNGDHIRMLDISDFTGRIIPYLQDDFQAAGVIKEPLSDAQHDIVRAVAPLVQERVTLLSEVPGMVAFLFRSTEELTYDDDTLSTLPTNAAEVLAATIGALQLIPLSEWNAEKLGTALRTALVEELGLKPRIAFGPARVAISGRRVSPPLFESMEILGKQPTIDRITKLSGILSA